MHMLKGKTSIPTVYSIGTDKNSDVNKFHVMAVMIMEMLGPSLEDLFNLCDRKFDLTTCCLLAR